MQLDNQVNAGFNVIWQAAIRRKIGKSFAVIGFVGIEHAKLYSTEVTARSIIHDDLPHFLPDHLLLLGVGDALCKFIRASGQCPLREENR